MTHIHADDYALTVKTSKDMIELMKEGVLDGISIVPNMSCFNECISLLMSVIPELPFLPAMSVHLDLVEGLSLSDNDGSVIGSTWKSLFFSSFNVFSRRTQKEKLKNEIDEQIKRGWDSICSCMKTARDNGIPCLQEKLRIDSHQHTHMIPIVWSALTECLRENGYETEYIRNSKEPLRPFLRIHSLWKSYSMINLVKNRILWVLSARPDIYDKKEGRAPMYLWGLMMSGRMDAKRVKKLYSGMVIYAQKDGRDLEILFHPGRMGEHETTPQIPITSAESFYLSTNRDTEKAGARKCRMIKDRDQVL